VEANVVVNALCYASASQAGWQFMQQLHIIFHDNPALVMCKIVQDLFISGLRLRASDRMFICSVSNNEL